MFLSTRFLNGISRYSTSNGIRRSLHHHTLNSSVDGSSIYGLKNNIFKNQALSSYQGESWQKLTSDLLRPNTFYIYLDKASLDAPHLYAGHILSFLTNDSGLVEESCISLRNGAAVDDRTLVFRLSNGTIRHGRVYNIKLRGLKDEFDNFLFNRADSNKPVDQDVQRYLIGLPLDCSDINGLLERIRLVKLMCSNREYILHSGIIDNKSVQPLNCITGFYRGVNVIGTESDPSPQMALWSYLRFIWGAKERDVFIAGTGLRDPKIERDYDDILRVRDSKLGHYRPPRPTTSIGFGRRQFGTLASPIRKDASYSVWDRLSESDKLQSALDTDEPENADVAYYKGRAFTDIGPQYSGYAIAAFRDALQLCQPHEVELRRKCEEELHRLDNDSAELVVSVNTQPSMEIHEGSQIQHLLRDLQDLKNLVIRQQRSIERLERKIDGT